jgi:hypothetical protein
MAMTWRALPESHVPPRSAPEFDIIAATRPIYYRGISIAGVPVAEPRDSPTLPRARSKLMPPCSLPTLDAERGTYAIRV